MNQIATLNINLNYENRDAVARWLRKTADDIRFNDLNEKIEYTLNEKDV